MPCYHWFRTVNSDDEGNNNHLNLRLSGSGSEAVVLTKDPPKYLRASISPSSSPGQVTITSNSHPERQWSLRCIRDATSNGKGTNEPMWHPVVIREGKDQAGEDSIAVVDGLLSHSQGQTTFLVATWNIGHPQLFWPSTTFDESKAPPFLTKVKVECYEMN